MSVRSRRRSTALGIKLGFAPALAALLVGQAPAQTSAPPEESAQPSEGELAAGIDEVVVRGRRMGEIDDELRIYIKDFIGEVVRTPPGRGFARWNRRVCIGVHNLEHSAAQYIVDRISGLALEVGLDIGEPGCQPDVVVIFATDAKYVATYMVENYPLLFRPAGITSGDASLGRVALDEFAASERAVRWWHTSMPVDARTGQIAVDMPGQAAPTVAVAGPSRIHSGVVDEMWNVFIVVDGTKLKGTTWQQIADYLAVVSLAQIDPETNPAAFDSILNLFSNPEAYSGLTDWDRTYVRALYSFDQERNPNLQTNALAGEMVRDPEAQRER